MNAHSIWWISSTLGRVHKAACEKHCSQLLFSLNIIDTCTSNFPLHSKPTNLKLMFGSTYVDCHKSLLCVALYVKLVKIENCRTEQCFFHCMEGISFCSVKLKAIVHKCWLIEVLLNPHTNRCACTHTHIHKQTLTLISQEMFKEVPVKRILSLERVMLCH